MPNLLIKSTPVTLTLTESAGGKIIARGEFGRVNVATQNGRIYREALMERQLARLADDISNRRVLGELDHPSDGKTSLKRVSHVITDLKIKDGIILGEAEILGTPEGRTLRALIEANVQIGVSSRGYGTTRPSNDPKLEGEVVQDDYVLKTWDFVADPAVKTAIPGMFTEDVDENQPDIAQMFLDEFPEIAVTLQEDAIEKARLMVNKGVDVAVSEAEKRVRDELVESFEKRLAQGLLEAREEISNELREEFSADPDVGGAKAMLEAIADMVSAFKADPDEKAIADALKARELEVAESRGEIEAAESRAVQAECREYVERKIGGHSLADSIRKLMSNHEFADLDDAKDKLATILKDLPSRTDEGIVSEEEAALREDNASLREKVLSLTERVDLLKSKLKRAVNVGIEADARHGDAESRVHTVEEERDAALDKANRAEEEARAANEALRLATYKYEKVAGLPKGGELLRLLENANSKDAVDKLVSERVRGVSESRLAEMRKNLRRGVGERQEGSLLNEDILPKVRTDELGNDMSFMQRLAGIQNE